MRRLWCDHCRSNQIVEELEFSVCCSKCGRVLEEDNFATHTTFTKDAGGHSTVDGNFVSSIASELGVSTERTLDKAHDEIRHIADTLGVSGGEKITKAAKNLYRMALEKNFTRGRRADQVAAACLYIVCRVENRPFLLIEFSDVLGVNVYVLGAVFLQLCRLLMLEEHPIIQKPVDPSLFIHRFANHLLGEKNDDVSRTALQILTRMKRDWMQTGRKPSGVCGAALYISVLSHGFKFNKADVVKVVHICEATLTKRLIEFEDTESGDLTIEEFNQKAQELEQNFNSTVTKMSTDQGKSKSQNELLCEHKDDIGEVHAHGLCEKCYREFLTLSGGLEGGSDPPAFQRAARERSIAQIQSQTKTLEDDHEAFEHEIVDEEIDKSGKADKLNDKSGEADKLEGSEGYESDRFSDIDDSEVDGYLHNEEEKKYKTIIWEEMNKEYLAEQAAKAKLPSGEEKPKKEWKQKRKAEEMNNPKTAAEATQQVLMQKMAKKYSSKINCDKLRELFGEAELSEGTETNGAETVDFKDELETMDEYEEQNGYGDYQDPSYYDYDGEENIEQFDDGLR